MTPDMAPAKVSLSLAETTDLLHRGNCVPVHATIAADLLTPISAYLKWCRCKPHSFLFESVLAGDVIGRYSFLGCTPRKVLQSFDSDPLVDLEAILNEINPVAVPDLPPFTGGAVGFIGYDCIRSFEPKTNVDVKDVLKIPDAVLMLCDSIVIFDHLYSLVKIVSNVILTPQDLASPHLTSIIALKYNTAINEISTIISHLQSPEILLPSQPPINSAPAVSNIGKDGYMSFVRSLKQNIVAGDIIQVVPSQRLSKVTNLHPFNAYRQLRTVNPAPYMFYVGMIQVTRFGDVSVGGRIA